MEGGVREGGHIMFHKAQAHRERWWAQAVKGVWPYGFNTGGMDKHHYKTGQGSSETYNVGTVTGAWLRRAQVHADHQGKQKPCSEEQRRREPTPQNCKQGAVTGKGHMVDGRDNAWRRRAPGPHARGNTARQVMDGLWTEARGRQKQSNDTGNNQHNLNTPTTGRH